MSNSSLISGVLRSPNHSNGRNHIIDRITPHYMDWYTSAKTCCESFLPTSRQASSNYCIGKDGEIWLCVDENNRAWTTGSSYNDNRAVTIECANYRDNSNGHVIGQLPDKTWDSLVKLCADICVRNGIKAINYTGNDNGNLTMHKWYQSTDCPGPWLSNQFNRLANEINKLINGTPIPTPDYGDFGGTYKCNVETLNVRTAPNVISGKIVAQYHKGQTVNLDNWYEIIDGMVWSRYTGSTSGLQRYVCVGKATGKAESDDYLVKV